MLLHGALNKKKTKIPPECRVSTTARVLLIALIAIISRLFCIIYTIIWNKLINNYKFSNNILCYGDKGGGTLWQYIKCFSYWDGEYFLRLSLNETEYLYEQNHAFFPSLPLIIIYTKNLLKRFLLNMNECEMHVLIALFILRAEKMHIMMKKKKKSSKRCNDRSNDSSNDSSSNVDMHCHLQVNKIAFICVMLRTRRSITALVSFYQFYIHLV
ncbi:mannosyltransferase [Plasmodium malariae]|uniref:GPI mannosyltransferase 2 n=1 Tax=Plasmodium malariae TaxID=5858 RepID=A0A1A8WHX5_PLAMA|nr:mannosyltransferase [Plasmodium malariae]